MLKGKLKLFLEQGMEHNALCFYENGKSGYEALNNITEENYIKIYNKQDELVFEGEIIYDDFSGWKPTSNKLNGQLYGGVIPVNFLQYGVEPEVWFGYFAKEYKAKLYESKMSKEEKKEKKKQLMKELKKKYEEERKYKDTLLNKTRITLNRKDDIFELLKKVEKRYQIFDDEYHTLLIENYKENKIKNKKNLEKLKKIKKSEAFLIDIDIKEEVEKIKEFEEFNKKNNIIFISSTLKEMEDKGVSLKNRQKLEKKYNDLEKKYKKSRKSITEKLFEEIDKIDSKLLIEEYETVTYYEKEESIAKLIKFPKKLIKLFD